MKTFIDSTIANLPARTVAPLAAPRPMNHLPSFARALRLRGLLARAEHPAGTRSGWPGNTESWLGVASAYETHLHRAAMEQAMAALRGDSGLR